MLLRDLMWVYAQGTLGRIKRALKNRGGTDGSPFEGRGGCKPMSVCSSLIICSQEGVARDISYNQWFCWFLVQSFVLY